MNILQRSTGLAFLGTARCGVLLTQTKKDCTHESLPVVRKIFVPLRGPVGSRVRIRRALHFLYLVLRKVFFSSGSFLL